MNMEKKFYRELNALSINGAKVESLTKEELENQLISKLKDKAHHIVVIFNDQLRNEYLISKNKQELAKSMTLNEVKRFLALRVSIDILQLATDLAKIYRSRVVLNNAEVANLSESDINKELTWVCEKLITKKHKEKMLDVIAHLIVSYIAKFDISIEELESERVRVENNEGSYYNGKFVIFER